MNDLAYLLDQACNWDQLKAEAILDECIIKGYKLKTIYPMLGQNPDPEDVFVGKITDGSLYLALPAEQ